MKNITDYIQWMGNVIYKSIVLVFLTVIAVRQINKPMEDWSYGICFLIAFLSEIKNIPKI